jgi:hypothetical protein
MSPTNHHGTNNELAEDRKVAAKRCEVGGVAKGKPDITVGRHDFKEDGEDAEGLWTCISVSSIKKRGGRLTGSFISIIRLLSPMHIQNTPRKIYHKSKLNWFRI